MATAALKVGWLLIGASRGLARAGGGGRLESRGRGMWAAGSRQGVLGDYRQRRCGAWPAARLGPPGASGCADCGMSPRLCLSPRSARRLGSARRLRSAGSFLVLTPVTVLRWVRRGAGLPGATSRGGELWPVCGGEHGGEREGDGGGGGEHGGEREGDGGKLWSICGPGGAPCSQSCEVPWRRVRVPQALVGAMGPSCAYSRLAAACRPAWAAPAPGPASAP